jgi:hypothetical protein
MVSSNSSRKNYDLVYVSIVIVTIFSFVLSFSFLYESILSSSSSTFLPSASIFFSDDATVSEAYAQPYIQTVTYRNLTIDLGNGVKTNLTLD